MAEDAGVDSQKKSSLAIRYSSLITHHYSLITRHYFQDFSRIGEAAEVQLGENQGAVHSDFKRSSAATY